MCTLKCAKYLAECCADFKGLESGMESEPLTRGQASGQALAAGPSLPCAPGAEFHILDHLVDRERNTRQENKWFLKKVLTILFYVHECLSSCICAYCVCIWDL